MNWDKFDSSSTNKISIEASVAETSVFSKRSTTYFEDQNSLRGRKKDSFTFIQNIEEELVKNCRAAHPLKIIALLVTVRLWYGQYSPVMICSGKTSSAGLNHSLKNPLKALLILRLPHSESP